MVGVSLAVALVGWWFARGEPPSAPEPTAVEDTAAEDAAPEDAAPEDAADAPVGPALHALARAAGMGFISCSLPPGTSAIAVPWRHGHRLGDTVHAAVDEESGRVPIYPLEPPPELLLTDPQAYEEGQALALEPIGALTWSGARPGAAADCSWGVPETVTLRGQVRGSPEMPPLIYGCDPARTPSPIADDGRFVLTVQRQSVCAVRTERSSFHEAGTTVGALADRDGVMVTHGPPSDSAVRLMISTLLDRTRGLEDELATYSAAQDAFSVAMRGDASRAIGDLLREWRVAHLAQLERTLQFQGNLARSMEASLSRQEALLGE